MQAHVTTTPFGRRPMSLGQISSQMTAREVSPDVVVNKWHVFQHVREARGLIGATDRSLAILNALLSFHPEANLAGNGELIVWPSNEQLAARANGMSPATLRRHLAVLVECGLIIRRDSPNGKRFARKGRGGEIEQAYGFDLAPIVARAAEFSDLADAVQAEKKAFRVARERLTLLRRDIAKMIDAGIEEGVPGNWGRVQQAYRQIIERLPRAAPRQLVETICEDLQDLWADIRDALETFAKTGNQSANESQFERHIQNSNPDSSPESKNGSGNHEEASGSVERTDSLRSLPSRDLPLGIVLDACSGLRELAEGGEIRHWRDFLAAVEVARTMLGVSPSAWTEAQAEIGERQAAIAMAAIYQRADQINSPGGYLRSLTERAKQGKFSTWPMIMALLRARLDTAKAAGGAEHHPDPAPSSPAAAKSGFQASPELLRSLRKPKWK